MIQKYFESGKSRKLCPESVPANANLCEESLEACKLYVGFKDCLLVKNFSTGMKVSSRNSTSEFFFDFNYLL